MIAHLIDDPIAAGLLRGRPLVDGSQGDYYRPAIESRRGAVDRRICNRTVMIQYVLGGRAKRWVRLATITVLAPLCSVLATGSVTVTNLDEAAVRQAIQSGGVVRLAHDGVIGITREIRVQTNTTVDASGHAVILDGGESVRHFVVSSNATLRLVNLTLRRGRHLGLDGDTDSPGNPAWGGSICSEGGSLELVDCRFIDNQALAGDGGPALDFFKGNLSGGSAHGGAIYCTNASVFASNCLFERNSCIGGQGKVAASGYGAPGGDAFGGAVFISGGMLQLVGAEFAENLSQSGNLGGGRALLGGGLAYGGAVAKLDGTGLVTRCTFKGNQALGSTKVASRGQDSASANGGAFFQRRGELMVALTLFTNNAATGGKGYENGGTTWISADGNGGALFNSSGSVELVSSAFVLNRANGGSAAGVLPGIIGGALGGFGSGGAICNFDRLVAVNCTFSGNEARGGDGPSWLALTGGSAFGGAICNANGSIALLNTTFAANSVEHGVPLEASAWGSGNPVQLGSAIATTNGVVVLTNSILFSLPPQTNAFGAITDGGHNIWSTTIIPFFSDN